SDGIKVIHKMLQLYKNYKPMRCFGIIAIILLLAAAILFAPILQEYIVTGLVPRFPTLIVCGFLALAAIQAIFSGMVLEVMAAKDKRDFEYRLNRIEEQKNSKLRSRGSEACGQE
ncbi:MAG: hypothetical protein K2H45_02995, partial [Acetatifactor sp.]|nr:hypothetical protein [Acetatifactor sp.]